MEKNRSATLRRVITGIDESGQSIIALDGPPAPFLDYGQGAGLYEIWTDDGDPLDPRTSPRDAAEVRLCPPAGGVKLRWVTVPPEAPGTDRAQAKKIYDEIFAQIGNHGERNISRHPGMHQTETLDYIILVEGRLRLLLDKDERVLSPGDVVVQRGTNHAWVCEGDRPALLVAVMIDKQFSGSE